MRRLFVVELVAVALLTMAATAGFHRVFVDSDFVGPLIGAGALAAALSGLAALRRFTVSASLLMSVVGFVVYVIYAALTDTVPNLVPTATTVRDLVGGVTGGWADMLTTSLPTRSEPRLLIVVLALTWFGTAFGAELAARSRHAVAPVVPPLVAYAATLALAASEPRSPLVLTMAVAALALFTVLVHTNRWATSSARERGPVRGGSPADRIVPEPTVHRSADRWITLGMPVIVLSVVASVAVVPQLPERRASFDPRSYRTQTVERQLVDTPLAALKAELRRRTSLDDETPPVVFTFETPSFRDARAIPHVRLAVLDRYDGITWSSTSRYIRAGTVLPGAEELAVPSREIRQRYTIGSFEVGPWLPVADRPVRLDAPLGEVEMAFDASTGSLIADGVPEGLTYELTSAVPIFTEEQLQAATPDQGLVDRTTVEVPAGLPDDVRSLAGRFTEDAGTAYERLRALERNLATTYGYDENVEPGHSHGRILQFLNADRRGYAEQFAATFALMARALGYPSRLVVGYLTAEPGPAPGQLELLTEITTRQAHVWPEVHLGDAGWVPFEPTPTRVPSPPLDDPGDGTLTLPSAGAAEAEAETEGAAGEGPGGAPEEDDQFISAGWLVLLTLLAATVLLVTTLIAAKATVRRRRRRSQGGTAKQVLGAWATVTDRLLELGVPVDRSMTAKEVLALSRERVDERAAERIGAMVPVVTMALFAPVEPAEHRVAEMWSHADAFRREVLQGRAWYSGMVASLNPKPLLHSLGRD